MIAMVDGFDLFSQPGFYRSLRKTSKVYPQSSVIIYVGLKMKCERILQLVLSK